MTYFVEVSGRAFGPFPVATIKGWIDSGRVTAETRASTNKLEWKRADEFPELAPFFGVSVGAVNHWVKAYREDGLTAHVPERRGYGSYGGETMPAPGNLADRDFTAGMPNGKWPADITRDQGRGREGRASRRRSTAATAGSSHARPVPVPTPGSPTGCSSGPRRRRRRERIPWCIPTADATAGGPDSWRSWTATA